MCKPRRCEFNEVYQSSVVLYRVKINGEWKLEERSRITFRQYRTEKCDLCYLCSLFHCPSGVDWKIMMDDADLKMKIDFFLRFRGFVCVTGNLESQL